MPTQPTTDSAKDLLTLAIQEQIIRRTWGRIHQLHVEAGDDRVIVYGITSSYFTKQLALVGVLDVLGSTASRRVELEIQVRGKTEGRLREPIGRLQELISSAHC